MDEVNADISSQVQKLRTDIGADISDLKHADEIILDEFRKFERLSDEKIEAVNDDLRQTKGLLEEKSSKLEAATIQLTAQHKKIVILEKACHRGLQHGRSFNIEIDGIPANVGDDVNQLQDAALKIFQAINADVLEYDIDTIHRLPSRKSPKPTIVRLVSRKSVRSIHANKRKLRDLGELDIDIPGINENTRIFIRPSQCAYYKNLAYNCRLLKREGLVEKVINANDGRITIQRADSKEYVKVTHETVLTSTFPNFQDFNFSYDDYDEDNLNEDK